LKRKLSEKVIIRDIREIDAALMSEYSYRYKKDASEYRLSYYYDETQKGVHRTLIAEYNGKIAGYLNVCNPGSGWHERKGLGENETYLYDLYVIWTYRRRGVAEALLREAFRLSEECSDFICLNVAEDNEAATALYRKLGFSYVCTEITANGQEQLLRKVVIHKGSRRGTE